MNLSPDQKATVTSWISAGDNLSAVQKKLRDQFQISMTYMDVRFLVDDLNLTLKDPAPKADTSDVTKAKAPAAGKPAAASAPEKKGLLDKAKEKLGLGKNPSPAAESDELPAADALEEDALPPVPGNVTIELDGVTLIPGAIASGSVTFSDGVTGKWIVDQYGRPGFTEVSQPGYRPSPEDGQAFMQELDAALRQKGF
ncbi:MAG: hypothetical protein NTU80_14335 [Verrucomicrobia bacterium]|nr:hypothetical protein [Verrucomicrobiota bacterium]